MYFKPKPKIIALFYVHSIIFIKKTFLLLTRFLYFFKKTMESDKLLLFVIKQDLNYLNDWHKFEMFRKLIKSIEETSFS